jgi:hypothetical protein
MKPNLIRLISLFIALSLAFASCRSSSGSSDDGVDAPLFSVFGSGIARTVSISCGTSAASIYYTTDGSAPTSGSSAYGSALTIAGYGLTQTIKAVAIKSGTSSDQSSTIVSIGSAMSLPASPSVTILAGTGTAVELDATGVLASFNGPYGVASDGTYLYVADKAGDQIRKIAIATGVVTTFAGSALNGPEGIATDGTNLYVSDSAGQAIRKIVIATGAVSTIAGSGSSGHADGTGNAASFDDPVGIATDGQNLYVADFNNFLIRKVVIATGVVTTIAGTAGTYVEKDGTGTAAGFNGPCGIATDGANLFVTDFVGNTIRKIVIATGVVTTLAGSASSASADTDGTGSSASFAHPMGIATDGAKLFVADWDGNTLRQVVIASGAVTTPVGPSKGLLNPRGVAADGSKVYIADWGNNKIVSVY